MQLMDENLAGAFAVAGRAAVVTGAASGIGRETARVLALAGAAVLLADIDERGLADAETAIGAGPGRIECRRTDVGERADIDALADHATARFGGIDIWVNAAGILFSEPIVEANTERLERLLRINMLGSYWGCAAAGRAMIPRGRGAIVNVASAGADMAVPGLSAYSMSKAAVNMLTRTAAAEFGPHGIRVNSVAPGFIDTPMVSYLYRDAEGGIDAGERERVFARRAQGVPLRTTGTPRDIALAILYLASDASRYMTGQILRPNGGTVMP